MANGYPARRRQSPDRRGSADGTAEVYDPSAGSFSRVDSIPGGGYRYDPWSTATLLHDGRVLIARGTAPPFASSTAGLYGPAAGTYTATDNLFWVHAEPVARLLADGRVIIVEGRDPACETGPVGTGPCGGTEIYDPVTGTFSPTGAVSGSPWRAGPTSNLLANGKVLVTGGDGGNDIEITTELYDPFARKLHSKCEHESLPQWAHGYLPPGWDGFDCGRWKHKHRDHRHGGALRFFFRNLCYHREHDDAPTLLEDGSVLMTGGGFGGQAPASAEVYHPAALIAVPMLFPLSGDGTLNARSGTGSPARPLRPIHRRLPGTSCSCIPTT